MALGGNIQDLIARLQQEGKIGGMTQQAQPQQSAPMTQQYQYNQPAPAQDGYQQRVVGTMSPTQSDTPLWSGGRLDEVVNRVVPSRRSQNQRQQPQKRIGDQRGGSINDRNYGIDPVESRRSPLLQSQSQPQQQPSGVGRDMQSRIREVLGRMKYLQ